MIAEPKNEVEKLLSLIFQSGGQVMVKDGQLWVGPPELARTFGDQIKRLKPEILIALGCCLVCGRELTVKVEETSWGKIRRHTFCSGETPWHFDKWKF